jgi:hypothetical protein
MILSDIIKNNLITLFTHCGCSMEQVNGFATNYVNKGLMTQSDADEVDSAMQPLEHK